MSAPLPAPPPSQSSSKRQYSEEYSSASLQELDTESIASGAEQIVATPEYSTYPRNGAQRLSREDMRASVARAIAAWGFGAAFMNITSGAIYTAFARSIGANDFAFGVLAAALPMMSFLQVIAARLVEGSGRRKRQMLIAGVTARTLWTFAAFIPLIARAFPDLIGRREVLTYVIGCVILAGAFQAFSTPAFYSWMTDLVPSRVRPGFFARRMQLGTWVAVATAIIGGLIADAYPHITTYCILIALAGVCGLLDILFFVGVREPRVASTSVDSEELAIRPKRKSPPLIDMVRVPLQDAPTRRFLTFTSLLMISYSLHGPFLWLYASEYLRLSKTMTNLLLGAIPLIALASTVRFWGEVIRRYGNRPVMRVGSLGLALSAVGWLVARPGAWDILPILLFISGTMVGAVELANQNLLMRLSPHIPRSSMVAVFSIVAGLSFAGAAWIGGAIAQALEWINTSGYDVLGMQIINYHVLFLLALGVRLILATFIAPRLHEPEATSTLETVKEIVPEIAQAFAARFTRPLGVREN